ncbi:phenylacetate-CoA oxygenase subunit PaaC [Sulfitobacter pseudonitzschiae]|uniref:Phenylacetate-CoA oxygenase subunit PaaC n=1 Tax=Pseudosulfitobacter pseudonitzschiae TaxID=1402135 RepID=A0A9Q2RVI7_9RHOB|nr:1,2-phenylacetyl-CoA epoxidase subunit PaaC [Pseudosulfitobacter pseudonitzschiae]MBM2290749.1 phenylacetate-CoA oxygenase subunit PaaC [Pseudosulfitobacter pseudonitzschiae]MBM2295667.1 phenylacetate-CoA oxygenase subunit PaaC [Pseudosulfitobacter pseudonitzschiae]MBM2300579.1 phenylacetate-CoA oxygenase subunit PaaC [Pseudosulfitobacter pseudonitzschiae]MBM2310364.1 phenylacetate-CoA oxygenase subunit PaaC [Pseudosulfitobacter pseudonitzschiae]MBM2315276.1 phenylacetate-CoA oxygenase subu
MTTDAQLFEWLCRMGDNALVLGHRMSEWCGHAPVLEEDIALANTALDLIGQTQLWLGLAAEVEGAGRDADALAYRRDVLDFRNLLLVEQPNRDFGHTMMRQFLFDAWHIEMLRALKGHDHEQISAIAEKSLKEVTYHAERSADTVIALGDGTEESHKRMQAALDRLWPYVGEMFLSDDVDRAVCDPAPLREAFDARINAVLTEATLTRPDSDFAHKGGKTGVRHTEHLGHMLAVMQFLPRAYPDAQW